MSICDALITIQQNKENRKTKTKKKEGGYARKIVKQTLSEQIYNILKEDILCGRILMGDKLTNRELQERFQVSSTPVRDAINRLSKDGLTQEVSKSGAQLITFDYSYANELNDFITFLASKAVMLSGTEPDQKKLWWKSFLMYEEEMARAKTSIEYFEADFRYHKVFLITAEIVL